MILDSQKLSPCDNSLTATYSILENTATFTARIVRDGEWVIAFSPEFPEGNGQGLTEEEALASLRESILLLLLES